MSSWLDAYLNWRAKQIGMKPPSQEVSIDDALRQDPGAQSEVDRYMNAGRAQNAAHGITEIPHWSEALRGPKPVQDVVHLPPIQMQRDVPELPTQPETAYDIQRRQQPPAQFNTHLLDQLIDAEERSGVSQPTYGRGDGNGKTMFFSPQQGRDMDEDEARAYLDFLEGR